MSVSFDPKAKKLRELANRGFDSYVLMAAKGDDFHFIPSEDTTPQEMLWMLMQGVITVLDGDYDEENPPEAS